MNFRYTPSIAKGTTPWTATSPSQTPPLANVGCGLDCLVWRSGFWRRAAQQKSIAFFNTGRASLGTFVHRGASPPGVVRGDVPRGNKSARGEKMTKAKISKCVRRNKRIA